MSEVKEVPKKAEATKGPEVEVRAPSGDAHALDRAHVRLHAPVRRGDGPALRGLRPRSGGLPRLPSVAAASCCGARSDSSRPSGRRGSTSSIVTGQFVVRADLPGMTQGRHQGRGHRRDAHDPGRAEAGEGGEAGGLLLRRVLLRQLLPRHPAPRGRRALQRRPPSSATGCSRSTIPAPGSSEIPAGPGEE